MKIRIILDISTRILWSVNTLANSFGVNEARLGRSAIGGSIIIIERLRRTPKIGTDGMPTAKQHEAVVEVPKDLV